MKTLTKLALATVMLAAAVSAQAEFAAAGDFARGVVEHVGRAFGEEAVALRVGVRAQAEEHFAGVVHVHVVVHHHDVFGEHHLP